MDSIESIKKILVEGQEVYVENVMNFSINNEICIFEMTFKI
jgi:hypothetical protein